jgi:chromosome segregation ATPase
VIKLESAHIEEVRGIRKLDLDFRKETFAISGPNGSGKNGVIDVIEFGLTDKSVDSLEGEPRVSLFRNMAPTSIKRNFPTRRSLS